MFPSRPPRATGSASKSTIALLGFRGQSHSCWQPGEERPQGQMPAQGAPARAQPRPIGTGAMGRAARPGPAPRAPSAAGPGRTPRGVPGRAARGGAACGRPASPWRRDAPPGSPARASLPSRGLPTLRTCSARSGPARQQPRYLRALSRLRSCPAAGRSRPRPAGRAALAAPCGNGSSLVSLANRPSLPRTRTCGLRGQG